MMKHSVQALLEKGYLRKLCEEPLRYSCPSDGTVLEGFTGSGTTCPSCMDFVSTPVASCDRCHRVLNWEKEAALCAHCCKQMSAVCPEDGSVLSDPSTKSQHCPVCMQDVVPLLRCPSCPEFAPALSASRNCYSIEQYKTTDCLPAFGPEQEIWSFKTEGSPKAQVAPAAEIIERIQSGTLDGLVLVRNSEMQNYERAERVEPFRSIAVPHLPEPAPVPAPAPARAPVPRPAPPPLPSPEPVPPESSAHREVGAIRRTINLSLDLGTLFFILEHVSVQQHAKWFGCLFIAEWLFGLSPGKIVSFSRTRTAEGERAGLIRTAWRNLLKYAILSFILWLAHNSDFTDYLASSDFLSFLLVFVLICFWTSLIKMFDAITGCRVTSW